MTPLHCMTGVSPYKRDIRGQLMSNSWSPVKSSVTSHTHITYTTKDEACCWHTCSGVTDNTLLEMTEQVLSAFQISTCLPAIVLFYFQRAMPVVPSYPKVCKQACSSINNQKKKTFGLELTLVEPLTV